MSGRYSAATLYPEDLGFDNGRSNALIDAKNMTLFLIKCNRIGFPYYLMNHTAACLKNIIEIKKRKLFYLYFLYNSG